MQWEGRIDISKNDNKNLNKKKCIDELKKKEGNNNSKKNRANK